MDLGRPYVYQAVSEIVTPALASIAPAVPRHPRTAQASGVLIFAAPDSASVASAATVLPRPELAAMLPVPPALTLLMPRGPSLPPCSQSMAEYPLEWSSLPQGRQVQPVLSRPSRPCGVS